MLSIKRKIPFLFGFSSKKYFLEVFLRLLNYVDGKSIKKPNHLLKWSIKMMNIFDWFNAIYIKKKAFLIDFFSTTWVFSFFILFLKSEQNFPLP